jgi:hypothetical protein
MFLSALEPSIGARIALRFSSFLTTLSSSFLVSCTLPITTIKPIIVVLHPPPPSDMLTPDELLFWVVPRNRPALEALRNANKKHHVAFMSEFEEAVAITCDGTQSRTPGCLVTFGREGDIEICGSLVSSIQC